MPTKKEIWKNIPGFSSYQASDSGRIRRKAWTHIKRKRG